MTLSAAVNILTRQGKWSAGSISFSVLFTELPSFSTEVEKLEETFYLLTFGHWIYVFTGTGRTWAT